MRVFVLYPSSLILHPLVRAPRIWTFLNSLESGFFNSLFTFTRLSEHHQRKSAPTLEQREVVVVPSVQDCTRERALSPIKHNDLYNVPGIWVRLNILPRRIGLEARPDRLLNFQHREILDSSKVTGVPCISVLPVNIAVAAITLSGTFRA